MRDCPAPEIMRIILYRYLIREQLIPVSVCLLGLTLVLLTGRLMQVIPYLFASSVTPKDFIELMALAMPRLLLYALPMATLVGVLIAFVRLKEDNELVAIRAAGVGFHQFRPAVLSVILMTTLISFFNTIYIMPVANIGFDAKLKTLGRASIPALLQERTFIDMVPNLVFFFHKVNSADLSVEGLFLQDRRTSEVKVSIVAERAQLFYQEAENQLLFRISDGIITRVEDDLEDAQTVSFKVYDFLLSLDELFQSSLDDFKHKSEMSMKELYQMITLGKGLINTNIYALELHQRLALPMSCFLLGLVAAPLGALFRQGHRIAGMTIGLTIFLTYYILLSAGKGFGESGLIPPFLAVWAPNLLTATLVFYLWTKMRRETPFTLASLWGYYQSRFQRLWKTHHCDQCATSVTDRK
jgi:lipopolysaccharide export system permease protein